MAGSMGQARRIRPASPYWMWIGGGILALAMMMLIGIELTRHSPLFALLPLAPSVAVGAAILVFATLVGQRWILALLLTAIVIVFSANFRGKQIQIETDLPGVFEVEKEVRSGFDPVSLLKFSLFVLAFVAGAGALGAIRKRGLEMPAIGLFLYLSWAMVTAATSASPIYTIGATFGLCAWIIFAIALNDRLKQSELMLLVISATGLFCIASLVVYVLFPAYGQLQSYGIDRLRGIAATTNHAAQIAVVCLVTVIAFYVSGSNRELRGTGTQLWVLIAAAAALPVLVLSDTRSALAAGLLAAAALLRERLRFTKAAVVVGLLLVGVPAIAIVAAPGTMKYIDDLAGGISRSGNTAEIWSLAGRASTWSFTIDQISEQPVKGYGYGAGAKLINENYTTQHRDITISGSAHNAFLQTSLDLGLVGLALFVGIFIWSVRQFFLNPSPFRDGMFLIVLITCLFESAVSKVANELTILWLISLFAGSSPSRGSRTVPDTTGPGRDRGG